MYICAREKERERETRREREREREGEREILEREWGDVSDVFGPLLCWLIEPIPAFPPNSKPTFNFDIPPKSLLLPS